MEQQRLLLIQEYEEGASVSELAEGYAISRKTVYKWVEHYEQIGSRRPHESPHQVSVEVEAAIIEARQRWKWGPRKLRAKLVRQDAARQWPSISTIALVLKNKGLVVKRSHRAHTPIQTPPYVSQTKPTRSGVRITKVISVPATELASIR